MKVLIVDDKSENLYLLESILKGSGYITVSANNGAEALNLARKDIPDLIITDILMPVMDGFTLCREFKKDEKLCNVPFIFYTATYSDPRDEEFALKLGADRFILKPQDPEEFIAIVKELLKEGKKKNIKKTEAPSIPETVILKEYSEVLVRKLEDKMLKLEQSEKEIRKNNSLLLKEIEERKRTEELLRKSEERFKQVSENAKEMIWEVDHNGIYIYVSPVIKEILGYEVEEIVGIKHFYDFFDPEIKEDLKQTTLGAFANKASFKDFVNCNIHKDGRKVFLSTSGIPILDKEANLIGYRGVDVDITERKLMENELRESEARLNEAMQIAMLGTWEYDVDSGQFKFNDQFYKIMRTTAEREGGYFMPAMQYAQKFVHPDDISVVGIETNKALETTDPNYHSHLDHRIIFADGDEGYVSVNIRIDKDSLGRTVKTYGVNQNITERKRVESELIASKEKAEEMNRLKSNFLANMSHELRTPLMGILGYADFLRQDAESEEKREMAETIFKSGKRLSETLNLILDLSRLETEKAGIKYQEIDLVSKAKEIISLFNETAIKKGLSLISSFSQDSIIINFEERTFHSILNNLINNAIKFTSEGSVTISISLNNDFVEIKVIDTGIGIAEMDYKTIFEEFRQVSEGYNRNFEGSGLGLNITKKLVEKFGGTITVESEIGKGTTFKVVLPAINTEEKQREPIERKSKIIQKSGKQKSVKPIALLVDDDSFVFTVLKRYASEYIELETTVDADFAFKMLKKKQYDLIFMDINLRRGMDGKEATKKIRSMKGYENIPIVATTAYAMLGDKEEFLTAGCTHYLSKPFSRLEIEELLEEVFKLV
jgi:PAS domain S-box-containing protein